jgi:hypothetical protein
MTKRLTKSPTQANALACELIKTLSNKPVPCWSPIPIDRYYVHDGRRFISLRKITGDDVGVWNLFFAVAYRRLDAPAEIAASKVVLLDAFPQEVVEAMGKCLIYRVPLDGSTKWSLRSWMCTLSGPEYMDRFWPLIASMIRIPESGGHVFLEPS